MKTNNKIYWKGIDQLKNDPQFIKNNEKEFPEHIKIEDAYGDNTDSDAGTSRRDFMKLMGFGIAAVSLAACEAPIKKAIPYLNKPEDIDPGVPNYYASTYVEGGEYVPVLVKTREGRPIHVEGNKFSSVTNGNVSARAVASVMSLYDTEKTTKPTEKGKESSWSKIDADVIAKLESLSASGTPVAIVSNSILSPSTKKLIGEFKAKYSSVKHVTYDQESAYAVVAAAKAQYGKAILPNFKFEKAEVVVSLAADFLGTWIAPAEYNMKFSATRKVGKAKKKMSRLYAFEAIMSLTGANADYRTAVKPSQEGLVALAIYNKVAQALGGSVLSGAEVKLSNIDKAVADLLAAKGKSLVVSGSNDVAVQQVVAATNQLLGNIGTTIDLDTPAYYRQGNDVEMSKLVDDIAAGTVGGAIFLNCNPVYDHPKGASLAKGIAKLQLSVATADRLNETASLCQFNCPDSHYLESWNDAEAKKGFYSLTQPTIGKIFDTRQAQESFLTWMGAEANYYLYVKNFWKSTLYPLKGNDEAFKSEATFKTFWQRALHNGVFEPVGASVAVVEQVQVDAVDAEETAPVQVNDLSSAVSTISATYKADNKGDELVIYSKVITGAGQQANNPMLQETPDPISRVCWGNYLSVSKSIWDRVGFVLDPSQEGKVPVAKVTANGVTISLPIVYQPGQAEGTIAVALGFGRGEKAGKVAVEAGGANAFPLVTSKEGVLSFTSISGVVFEKTAEFEKIAQTQTYNTILGRQTIVQETTLKEFAKTEYSEDLTKLPEWRYDPKITGHQGAVKPDDLTLWDVGSDGYNDSEDDKKKLAEKVEARGHLLWSEKLRTRGGNYKTDVHEYVNHHWGLAIDLNTCFGCAACVVACHTENNVPVVGKEEVIKKRDMHWLRIDRYYSSLPSDDYNVLIEASENPEVVFQPMMCQHCNNAPCETVCPVAATTHSSEGLNQMTYNRCVGTKYCANNCPYKVRRFNWFKYHSNKDQFDYHMANDLGRMVLNPDVTVRSRGVMEKCSMCAQRVQAGKLKAKVEGRPMQDGDADTACSSACPSGAILFGDLNDPKSEIRSLMDDEVNVRAYNVLEEIGVKPNVWYLSKVRNREELATPAPLPEVKKEKAPTADENH